MRAIVVAALVMAGLSGLFMYVDVIDKSEGRISMLEFVVAGAGALIALLLVRYALGAAADDAAHSTRRKLMGGQG